MIPSVKKSMEKVAVPLYIYSVDIVGGSSRIPSVKTSMEKVAVPLYIYSVEIVGGSSRIPSVKTLRKGRRTIIHLQCGDCGQQQQDSLR